jgi:hypothetical protein
MIWLMKHLPIMWATLLLVVLVDLCPDTRDIKASHD